MTRAVAEHEGRVPSIAGEILVRRPNGDRAAVIGAVEVIASGVLLRIEVGEDLVEGDKRPVGELEILDEVQREPAHAREAVVVFALDVDG